LWQMMCPCLSPCRACALLLQAQLQAELAPYGIDTQVVDRYIVSVPQFSCLSTAAAAPCCCNVVCLTSPRLSAA